MVMKSWIYDAIIYIYTLSLLFYFSDFVEPNRRAKQFGTGLLAFVWVLQTVFFISRMRDLRQPAVFSMFDSLFFFAWLIVTLSLVLNVVFRMDVLVFFVNIVGIAVLALNFFTDESVSPLLEQWHIEDELLFIHVSLAICSYAAFLVSAVLSGMYLFLNHMLKKKQWTQTIKRLPSLDKIDKSSYIFVLVGTPFLILSLTLGMVWLHITGHLQLMLDPKVLNSLLVIAVYGFYLTQRLSWKKSGTTLALWNLAAFAFVFANFVLSNFLSRFHQWIWL